MWPWPIDESQQTLVIAILGFIGAFLLTHYLFGFKSPSTIKSSSNSYNGLIESLLSQYSAKFAATTKIIEGLSLRLELLERALEQIKSGTKSQVIASKSASRPNNLSLLSNTDLDDDVNRNHDAGDIRINSDIIKSYHELNHDSDAEDGHDSDAEDGQGMVHLVLKLLSERSMSSIEVQSRIGRTREHTSRFMKRLFMEGLVSRKMNTKPFVYTLTDEGRKRLKVFRSDV